MILFLQDKFPEAESLDQRISIFLLLTYIVKTFPKCYKLYFPEQYWRALYTLQSSQLIYIPTSVKLLF